jgi:Flp pilus assembly protein TadD
MKPDGGLLGNTAFRVPSNWSAVPFLVVLPLAIFWQVNGHAFIPEWDDAAYVTENPKVLAGLTWSGLQWAFTTFHEANWHPLTWLSHMVDVDLFGLWAGGHHLTNVVLHCAGAVALFLALIRMTGSPGRSLFVAALFAAHPLHVESVAWVSERKDVLCGLFWMLTLWGYAGYAHRPSIGRYALTLFFFVLGLMSKPMAVTIPFTLLLLDRWPLKRFSVSGVDCGEGGGVSPVTVSGLLLEKVPFFALSAASCAVTILAQSKGGAVGHLPSGVRAANAVVSYASYLGKTVWPSSLAGFYPYTISGITMWKVVAAALLLVCMTGLTIRGIRSRPYLAIGWLWFLGTLVPVIGLVQVGMQSMADRYTYVPLVGLFVIVAWGAPDLLGGWRRSREALIAGGGVVLLAFSLAARVQAEYWRSGETLFRHAIRTTSGNWLAHNNLGSQILREGRTSEAIPHFQEAIRIRPEYADAHTNLGVAMGMQGDLAGGIAHVRQAILLAPKDAFAHTTLGLGLEMQGKAEEAIDQFRMAIRLEPENVRALIGLGLTFQKQGKAAEAAGYYREALRIRPDSAEARSALEGIVGAVRETGGSR